MNNELFDFPFYKWEKELADKPFLKQPFGNLWETYTWSEVGLMARKLSTGLKSLGLEKDSHIGLGQDIFQYHFSQLLILKKLKIF